MIFLEKKSLHFILNRTIVNYDVGWCVQTFSAQASRITTNLTLNQKVTSCVC